MSHLRTDTTDHPMFRPAGVALRPVVRITAGPFEPSGACEKTGAMGIPDALVTGLLVIYPVLATVAVIAAGLFLSAPVA